MYESPDELKKRYYLDPLKYKGGVPEDFVKVQCYDGSWWINKTKLKSISVEYDETYGGLCGDLYGHHKKEVFRNYRIEFGFYDNYKLIVAKPESIEEAEKLEKKYASEIFGYEV